MFTLSLSSWESFELGEGKDEAGMWWNESCPPCSCSLGGIE